MPLTPAKINHIRNKYRLVQMGRTQPIVLVLKNPDNSTSTLVVNAVWKPDHDLDPTLSEVGPHAASTTDDVVSTFLLTDVSLAQMRSCIYAYPQTPTGAEVANRYIPMSITPKGMLVGGDRLVVTWMRQR